MKHLLPGRRRSRFGGPFACGLSTIFAVAASVNGAERFVSPTGVDSSPGTRTHPWRTVAKVNAEARAGDVITFLSGDYPGQLSPGADGREDAPVVFRSSAPLGARLLGGNPVIKLEARRHIVLDGFHIKPRDGTFLSAAACENLTIRNCRFEGSRGKYVATLLDKCVNVRLESNVFTRHLALGQGAVLQGNMIQANHCDRLVIVGNTIGRAGHSPAHLRECTRLLVRRNLFCAKWGRGFETFNAAPMLFEENVITEEVDSGGSADSRGKVMSIDGIFRRNLVVWNYDAALASNSYIYRKGMPAWVLRNSRLYNNTVYRNHSYAWVISGRKEDPSSVSGNIWMNNIFYRNDPLGDFRALRLARLGQGNRFVRNSFLGDRPGRKVIEKWMEGQGYRRFTLAEAEEKFGALFEENLELEPAFLAVAAEDYRLAPGSPCIDAGATLARTTRAGSGSRLPVDDARWFYDGFGIPGEAGDRIVIGDARRSARVTSVDRARNRLILDRELDWEEGETVSLPYVGAAPDLGAMEAGAEGEEWFRPISIPPNIRWRPPARPGEPLVQVDFEDETVEQWGYVWNLDRKRQTGYKRVRDTAAGGQCSLQLFATGNRSILGADVKPRVWEIDRFPIVRFAYRIPKGVPVGIWLDGFDTERNGSARVCVGGSPARKPGGDRDLGRYALMDDDSWHEITLDARTVREVFPDMKHLQAFSFLTRQNGKKGQRFWIDDFVIAPAAEAARGP